MHLESLHSVLPATKSPVETTPGNIHPVQTAMLVWRHSMKRSLFSLASCQNQAESIGLGLNRTVKLQKSFKMSSQRSDTSEGF